MRKLLSRLSLILLLTGSLGIYAQNTNQKTGENSAVMKQKTLIVYYSLSNNTHDMAILIQQYAGGDLVRLEPVKPYPDEYHAVVDQAKKEIADNFKPELKNKIKDIESYDTIFVGSPCWWSTIAPPVATFLSSYDLSGKTVIPFMTHEGSGLGRTMSDVRKLCPKSTVQDGLAVRGRSAKTSAKEVEAWLNKLQIKKDK